MHAADGDDDIVGADAVQLGDRRAQSARPRGGSVAERQVRARPPPAAEQGVAQMEDRADALGRDRAGALPSAEMMSLRGNRVHARHALSMLDLPGPGLAKRRAGP